MEIPGARLGSLILEGRMPGRQVASRSGPTLYYHFRLQAGCLRPSGVHLLSLKTESNLYPKNVPWRQYNNIDHKSWGERQ